VFDGKNLENIQNDNTYPNDTVKSSDMTKTEQNHKHATSKKTPEGSTIKACERIAKNEKDSESSGTNVIRVIEEEANTKREKVTAELIAPNYIRNNDKYPNDIVKESDNPTSGHLTSKKTSEINYKPCERIAKNVKGHGASKTKTRATEKEANAKREKAKAEQIAPNYFRNNVKYPNDTVKKSDKPKSEQIQKHQTSKKTPEINFNPSERIAKDTNDHGSLKINVTKSTEEMPNATQKKVIADVIAPSYSCGGQTNNTKTKPSLKWNTAVRNSDKIDAKNIKKQCSGDENSKNNEQKGHYPHNIV
jgi:hypothetical protein